MIQRQWSDGSASNQPLMANPQQVVSPVETRLPTPFMEKKQSRTELKHQAQREPAAPVPGTCHQDTVQSFTLIVNNLIVHGLYKICWLTIWASRQGGSTQTETMSTTLPMTLRWLPRSLTKSRFCVHPHLFSVSVKHWKCFARLELIKSFG